MAQNMQGTGRLEHCPCPRGAWGYVGNDGGAKWHCPCRMGACKQGQPAPALREWRGRHWGEHATNSWVGAGG